MIIEQIKYVAITVITCSPKCPAFLMQAMQAKQQKSKRMKSSALRSQRPPAASSSARLVGTPHTASDMSQLLALTKVRISPLGQYAMIVAGKRSLAV